MPACFKANYPATHIIIDCAVLFIEMPSLFCAQSQTYSSYKSHNTARRWLKNTIGRPSCDKVAAVEVPEASVSSRRSLLESVTAITETAMAFLNNWMASYRLQTKDLFLP